jgi:hypothetical protein
MRGYEFEFLYWLRLSSQDVGWLKVHTDVFRIVQICYDFLWMKPMNTLFVTMLIDWYGLDTSKEWVSTEYLKNTGHEDEWRKIQGRLWIQWLEQVKRDTERRGWFWGKVDEMQEWRDRQLETSLHKSTHESGNDIRSRKKKKTMLMGHTLH